ncbi:APC family permease [Streptacidiphilus jiangxiensis]|uniref:Amino acid transporter n=1 Tax=Streptacidiphilus jiangxiensis TaxID=235985 RepID=A0A1H7LUU2_STRJI|nr:APC family permease [Streptacidiphilus jiangxiensis]SEL02639.1 Amino acid transporter [Streptacidiphilus jiangxiensis]
MAGTISPSGEVELPESLGYRVKKRLLGKPLVTEQLGHEKLSNSVALGVLASDCISSMAYGSEQMLVVLIPAIGIAAFTALIPLTFVILGLLILLTFSYREVVSVYTRAGGSYVVARENFGPRVAQIAAVALLIDYIVTVAVQAAAGTDAIVSLGQFLWGNNSVITFVGDHKLWLTVAVVLLLCYGNLRGIREAGRAFALPAYLFMAGMGLLVVVGFIRFLTGDHTQLATDQAGMYALGHGSGFFYGASLLVMLRAFANGGSSLTGLEAISNGVSVFRNPQGRNARKTMVVMSAVLGTGVLGVSLLAHITHAMPFTSGTPTVVSQEASWAFGNSWIGYTALVFVQLATALVLYTGANTSFNGFPFLASFVAEDSFLPRQLTRRGHRLAFSSGIIVLTVVSLLLLIGTDGDLTRLVSLYAIGVFTGFTMAGAGMVKHHLDTRQGKWQLKVAINGAAAVASLLVVGIFAVTKFTEGAWLVVVIFPIGVWSLIKVNKRYREEAEALAMAPVDATNPVPRRQVMYILVDRVDLAVLKAIRYARSMRPAEIRAVHFMTDDREAERLRLQWSNVEVGDLSLEIVECPDRRINRALVELIARTAKREKSQITLLIPERNYSPILGRLLHRRTPDQIARAVGKLPNVVTTIVPFDVVSAHDELEDATASGVKVEKLNHLDHTIEGSDHADEVH